LLLLVSRAVAAAVETSERLALVKRTLELYAVPAVLTDPYNRIVSVNRSIAALAGDPMRDGLRRDARFIPSLMPGAYRQRFPRREDELTACLSGLSSELHKGKLLPGSLTLLEAALKPHPRLASRVRDAQPDWDGSVVIPMSDGATRLVREYVTPIASD
jgi:hypothetical protein